jgi:hypothetical protein
MLIKNLIVECGLFVIDFIDSKDEKFFVYPLSIMIRRIFHERGRTNVNFYCFVKKDS